MKILLTGYGSIGRKHFNNLSLLGYDCDVCDTDILPALKNNKTFRSVWDMERFDYDLVIVATPADTHYDMLHFFNNRKTPYIMIEKPLFVLPTPNQIMKEAGLPQTFRIQHSDIFVNHAYRFERGILKLKKLMDQGVAGNIRHASLENSYSFAKLHPHYDFEKCEGIIYDDSHIINISRFLFGEPDKILSRCVMKDFAQWNWTAGGVLVSHMTDTLNERYKKRIEVRGDKGTLVYNYRAHEVFFAPADENERVAIPYKHADHLAESLKYVLSVVENKGQFEINTLEDSIKDMEVIKELVKI